MFAASFRRIGSFQQRCRVSILIKSSLPVPGGSAGLSRNFTKRAHVRSGRSCFNIHNESVSSPGDCDIWPMMEHLLVYCACRSSLDFVRERNLRSVVVSRTATPPPSFRVSRFAICPPSRVIFPAGVGNSFPYLWTMPMSCPIFGVARRRGCIVVALFSRIFHQSNFPSCA